MDRVLVAGAGPAGLVTANVLAASGIPVTVLEAEPRLPENLRASTFQPPTLDMLGELGVADKLIALGRTAPRMQYRNRAGWRAEFDFGVLAGETKHPYRVQCEQFKLNQLLAARLSTFPHASIEFGTAVTGVRQDGNGVTVEAGARKLEGAWLVGADGGRSAVREAIGVKLEGFTWEDRFLVASTPFDFSTVIGGLADVTYFADPQQWYFLLRVVGLWRVMFPTHPEEKEEDILSDEGIERRLQGVYPKAGRYEIAHRTLYAVHQRIAENYRKGRVFLAGDAAHLNNPLGGMGMNGGIHDAVSLARKLAAVVRGEAPEASLDAYERERRPVALEYVNTITIQNKKNLEAKDPEQHRQWQEQMSRFAEDPALAKEYLLKVSMIASLRKAGATT